ncbi:MAG TPA: PQQ-binding-like beta-propeller repeat protein [Rhizomicrobium sp.]|nr:PQQ-binding-like beta-propeller repeat protein [Rhizomicrobium sp.]
MQVIKGLCLAAPMALMAGMAFAQAPKQTASIMQSPPGIPVYTDRITGGEPKTGQVNGTVIAPHPLKDYTPVSEDMLRHPDASDWLQMRGNYEGYGFSKLNQVNKANVGDLQLVWARGMEPGINEATPIVYKGVMYLGNPNDVIQAIDAGNGELLWQYRRNLPTLQQFHNNPWGQRKRSVFLYDDKLYTITRDNVLMALDAKTGRELWEVNRGGDLYATNTQGPIVVDGVVIAGGNCQEAPFGCFVTGNDAKTGKELWRNYLIPKPGEPGDKSWGKLPFEKRWITGVWGPITYDPQLDLVYYGSSGTGPSADAQRGNVGATMEGTNTRFAVEPKTGRIVWSHQVLPRDNWDQECTFEMMPITTPVHPDAKADGMMAVGRKADSASRRTLTGVPCKTSIMWSFDAAKGDFLWAKSTAVQNLVAGIDNKGLVKVNEDEVMLDLNKSYHQCPTHAGGRDWPYAAYSPESNAMYVQIQNLCADVSVRADNIPSQPHDQYNTQGANKLADGHDKIGRIDAISVETGKTLWSWETKASNYSPILATAGGVLFNGGMDRYLRALDQSDGKVLWETRLGSQIFGTPVTYSVDGRQYVAVAAGGGFNASSLAIFPGIDQPSGNNMVYVFALPRH